MVQPQGKEAQKVVGPPLNIGRCVRVPPGSQSCPPHAKPTASAGPYMDGQRHSTPADGALGARPSPLADGMFHGSPKGVEGTRKKGKSADFVFSSEKNECNGYEAQPPPMDSWTLVGRTPVSNILFGKTNKIGA